MVLKERKNLDEDENGLFLKNVDEDGIQIVEREGGGEVYVYYSEIPDLIKDLEYYKKEYYDKRNK